MKRKFKVLSILTALAMGASMSLTGCTKNGVPEHDHVYDDGKITTPSTCYSEGVRTYTCTVAGCKQTKTSPVAMVAHTWDDGTVTTQPKCNAEGEKTYTCTVEGCGNTKKESVEKIAHRWNDGEIVKASDFLTKGTKKYTCLDCGEEESESVAEHADFTEQYHSSATEQSGWLYGYASTYNWSAGQVEFAEAQADATDGRWKADGVEIGSGYVYSQNHAIVAYEFNRTLPVKTEAEVAISFKGEESATVLKGHLVVLDGEQPVKTVDLNGSGAKDWKYNTEEAIAVAQGYKLVLVFENAGTGKAGGELGFTITASCVHVWNEKVTPASCSAEGKKQYTCLSCEEVYSEKIDKLPHEYVAEITTPPTEEEEGVRTHSCKNCTESYQEKLHVLVPFEGADFGESFSDTLEGKDTGWEVGVVDYIWGEENFNFTKITAKNEEGDAFKDDSAGWKVIKGDWMAVSGMMGFAYRFYDRAYADVNLVLNGADDSKFSVRWALKDLDGNIKINNGKADWGGEDKDVTVNKKVAVEYGDVLYLLVNKEGNSDQNHFSLSLTSASAYFHKDFQLNESGEFNGWSVGVVDYIWASENFTFNKITAKNSAGDCYHSDNPWIDVKSDFLAVNGMMGFAYKFTETASYNFDFVLNGADGGNFSIRWALKDKDGNIKINNGKADWGGAGKDITVAKDISVEADDVLYILVNKEGDSATDQCKFNIALFEKEQTQPTPQPQEVEIANFKKDFYRDLNDKNSWLYGYSYYSFNGDESFEFHQFANYLEGDSVWKNNEDGSSQIKDDWIDVGWLNDCRATIGYHADEAMTFNLRLHFTGGMPNTRVIVRIGIKDSEGNLKAKPNVFWNGKENREWSIDEQFTLDEGDTIYIIFFDEHGDLPEGWANGNVDISLVQFVSKD